MMDHRVGGDWMWYGDGEKEAKKSVLQVPGARSDDSTTDGCPPFWHTTVLGNRSGSAIAAECEPLPVASTQDDAQALQQCAGRHPSEGGG